MAVRVVDYSKTFLSKTCSIDISHHGSSMYEPCQGISEEDKELRENLYKQFSFYNKRGNPFNQRTSFGFDGKQIYHFEIKGEPETLSDNPTKRNKYDVNIGVVKAGDYQAIQDSSDLELLLKKEGFKELKTKV